MRSINDITDIVVCLAVASRGPDAKLFNNAITVLSRRLGIKDIVLMDLVMQIREFTSEEQLLSRYEKVKKKYEGQNEPGLPKTDSRGIW